MSFLSITIRWTFFQSFLPKKSFGRFAQSYLVIFKELLSYRPTPLKVKPSLSLDLFLKSKAAHKELSPTHCQAFSSTFLTFFLKSRKNFFKIIPDCPLLHLKKASRYRHIRASCQHIFILKLTFF